MFKIQSNELRSIVIAARIYFEEQRIRAKEGLAVINHEKEQATADALDYWLIKNAKQIKEMMIDEMPF